jgi:uncharacterized membrane protein
MKKINLLIISLMTLISAVALPILPAQIPMHWNLVGEIDNWMPKQQAVWFFPIIAGVMWLMFQFLPKFDPKREKYALFQPEWNMIQTGLISFFAYLQLITFYISLNPSKEMMPLMFIGLGALFILLGNYLSKIRQNYFIGVRLPWTLASEENWNKTHRYASWCFVIAGILTLIEAYAIWYAPVVIFGSIMLAAFLPMIYSFLLFKKQESKMKLVYIGLVVLMAGVIGIRLASGEDDWICSNGQWVKHGQPSTAQPTQPCK